MTATDWLVACSLAVVSAIALVLPLLVRVRRTPGDVARELAEGLEDGSIVLGWEGDKAHDRD